MALQHLDTIQAFRALTRSTKFGIDRNGLIVYRQGYGLDSEQTWRDLFQDLAAR